MTQGIEIDEQINNEEETPDKGMVVNIDDLHQRLIKVELLDVTDRNNQLVHTKEWLLHNKDAEHLSLTGNLFMVECSLTGK